MSNKVFFRKAFVNQPFLVKGARVPFEVVAGNVGVIALDPDADKDFVAGLEAAAREHRSGVTRITLDEYDELKKKKDSPRPVRPSVEPLRVMPSIPNPFSAIKRHDQQRQQAAAGAAAAGGESLNSVQIKASVPPPEPPSPVAARGKIKGNNRFTPAVRPVMSESPIE